MKTGDLVYFVGPDGKIYNRVLGIVLGFHDTKEDARVRWFDHQADASSIGHWPVDKLKVLT